MFSPYPPFNYCKGGDKIRSGRTIESAFNLIVDTGDQLKRYSVNGFDDWIPANERTQELLHRYKQSTQYQEDNKDESQLLDEGFTEFINDKKELDLAVTKQEEKLGDLLDAFSRIEGNEMLEKERLGDIQTCYHQTINPETTLQQLSIFPHQLGTKI